MYKTVVFLWRGIQARWAYRQESRIGRDSPNPWIRKSAQIPGWLHSGEHEFLWGLAMQQTGGHILEIGTWCGKSTSILAGACIQRGDGSRVICIDTFCMHGTSRQQAYYRLIHGAQPGTYYQFATNATHLGFAEHVLPLAMTSRQASLLLDQIVLPLRLAFLDGHHDYEALCYDITLLMPHLVPGGIIAVHDVDQRYPEVEQAVNRLLASRDDTVLVGRVHCLTAFRVGETT